ncbi:hypothetical protein LCGC14_1303470, partial [marine sediment metagenome]
ADYTCGGAGDEVEINLALNALPAQGGRVLLLEGTYTLANPIVIPGDYITLEGQSWATFLDGDGLATTEHGISITSHSGVQIKNLSIQTQNGGMKTCHCIYIEDGANEFIIEHVYFMDSDSDAIHIEGTSINKGWILDNFIEGADDDGIHVDMGAGDFMVSLIITGNYIASTGLQGIYFGNTGTPAEHCVIAHNIIATTSDSGIWINTGNFILINDNTLDNCGTYGIYLRNVNDSTVEDNIIDQSDLHNIYLFTCAQCLVKGNYVYGAGDDAADNINLDTNSSDCTVIGNYSIWAGRYGIYLGGSRQSCSENYIASSGDDGIVVDSADFQANGNHIQDAGRDAAGTYHGIKITGTSDRGQVIANYIFSDGSITEDGIHLMSNVQYLQIVGNYCFDGMGSGIHLVDDNDFCMIKDNYCLENDDYGVSIDNANCANNTVMNNKLVGNVTGQINDVGTDTILPEVFVIVPNPDARLGTHMVVTLIDGAEEDVGFEFLVPSDFQELVRAQVFIVAGGAGDLRRSVDTNWGKVCAAEDYNTHVDTIAEGVVAVLADDITCFDIAAALTNLAARDLVGVDFTRHGDDVLDTVGADCYCLGFRMQYV